MEYIGDYSYLEIEGVKDYAINVKLVLIGSDGVIYGYDQTVYDKNPFDFHKKFCTYESVVDGGEIAKNYLEFVKKPVAKSFGDNSKLKQTIEEIKNSFNDKEIKEIIRNLT